MSYQQARQAVETYFSENWDATPVKYENAPFTRPEGDWVAFWMLDGESSIAGVGDSSNRYRHRGIDQVDIYTKQDTGTAAARSYADTIADLFRDRRIDSILFRQPSIARTGDATPSGFYRLVITIPFQRDTFFSKN